MNKKVAIFLSVIIVVCLIVLESFLFSPQEYRENVKVARVIDGDTLETYDGRIFRLANINTPEHGEQGYEMAKDFLKSYENKTLEIVALGTDKYARTLARLYEPDYVNLRMVEEGLASKFLVDKHELKKFALAEKQAIAEGKGRWRKSPYIGCVQTHIDAELEQVALLNECPAISTQGWKIKDESRKTYIFSLPFKAITLHSGVGKDNATDRYWGSTTIWNNDRDSLYFFDADGGLAQYESYGYE